MSCDETYNLLIKKGETFTLSLVWKDSAGNQIDLTSYTAKMQVREGVSSTTTILDLSTATGEIVLGGATGTIDITVSAVNTSAIAGSSGVYALEMDLGGVVTRLLEGNVTFSPEVVR